MASEVSNNGKLESKPSKLLKEKEKRKNKKKKQKERKQLKNQSNTISNTSTNNESKTLSNTEDKDNNVEIEYVTVNPLEQFDPSDPLFKDFSKVFDYFTPKDEDESALVIPEESTEEPKVEETEEEVKKMSKKEKKKQKRLSIAVLKQLVKRPDVVEAWDVTSSDPNLLVFLKSYRNTVPVPRHWNQKRKYLQGKRGIEKPPFQLPDFIAATGISKIRMAIQAKDDGKSLKSKSRDKMAPKMGKMDIDYRVLHDAFFRYQTKPKLTIHGDLYYEGKEFEITLKEKKPGMFSEDLKKALGMPEGAPPPWLINMQRHGPPPSYPGLKIPGLNAPIPEGARYGYHAGGWGKPPVDEFGRPLYGDVYGTAPPEPPPEIMQPIERSHWGEMTHEEEVEEEVEEGEGEGEEGVEEQDRSGYETPSGLTTPSGLETPESIELRKAPRRSGDEEDNSNKQLYQVLEEKQLSVGNAMFGSQHKYVMPEKTQPKNSNRVDLMKNFSNDKVEVALNPSDIEDMENLEGVLKKRYEEALDSQKEVREDVSDIIAEHQKKKRKKESSKDSKNSKKYKDFKF